MPSSSSITDVTDRVLGATKGLSGARFNDANKAEQSKIEKECAKSDDLRCDVVTLYRGGRYHLYKYQRYQDVRLAFAPEFASAFFGGDPDNFNFPRYDLDVTFLRVYQDGKPLSGGHYFKWSQYGRQGRGPHLRRGSPAPRRRAASPSPSSSSCATSSFRRSFCASPSGAACSPSSRPKGPSRSASRARASSTSRIPLKGTKGRVEALRNPEIFGQKMTEEKELRAKVEADPAMKEAYGGAWEAIAEAQKKLRNIESRYVMVEKGEGLLVRSLRARAPAPSRQHRVQPSRTSSVCANTSIRASRASSQKVTSTAPIYDELEILTLTAALTGMRAELGPDDEFVRKVLGKETPRELATRVVKGSKLRDPKVRKALFDGGEAAVNASKDSMLELARLIEPDARAVRKAYEDDVEAVVKKNAELIAKARFQVYGTSVYPDATGTLRLSFGQLRGWEEAGKKVTPVTTLGGAFDRATGKDPFALPKSWIDNKAKLDLSTPFNFSTTNDIIGGNSGSPVIDKEGRIVGLVFDGNIHSLGGDYAYDGKDNRAVAVHSAALLETLSNIYSASRIVEEIKAGR